MPKKNSNQSKSRKHNNQQLVSNVVPQPMTEETALAIKLVKADIERSVAAMIDPITMAISLGSGFPFLVSRLLFGVLGESAWMQIPFKYIHDLYYQYEMGRLHEAFLKEDLLQLATVLANVVVEGRINLTDSENNLLEHVGTRLRAMNQNEISLSDVQPNLLQVAELLWDWLTKSRINLTAVDTRLEELANTVIEQMGKNGEYAEYTVNTYYTIVQRISSVMITIGLKKIVDSFAVKFFPWQYLQNARSIQLAHIHTEDAGEKMLKELLNFKGTAQSHLKVMRVLARILFAILVVDSLAKNGFKGIEILSFLMNSFTISLGAFVVSNLGSDLADAYHYLRDPSLMSNARDSLQEITKDISTTSWCGEYKGTLDNSYLYINLEDFKGESKDFSFLSLSKIRNTLIDVFLKYKLPVFFGSADCLYIRPNFRLSKKNEQKIGGEIKRQLQFLSEAVVNKAIMVEQLNDIARACKVNIGIKAQVFSNKNGMGDYQFVMQILSPDEARINSFYANLIYIYGQKRVKKNEVAKEERYFIVEGSTERIRFKGSSARTTAATATQVIEPLPQQQEEPILLDTSATGGSAAKRNPQYKKKEKDKPEAQQAKPKQKAKISAKELIITWGSGIRFDLVKFNSNDKAEVDETMAVPLEKPYWPSGTHFSFFASSVEEFTTDDEFEAFSEAIKNGSIVPTDKWVQKESGDWFHAFTKVKLGRRDARLYESNVETVVTDGQERTLHTYGIYVQHAHK